ncbi:MAG: DUF3108 domain-containing protein [Desulfobaccales bacterium]
MAGNLPPQGRYLSLFGRVQRWRCALPCLVLLFLIHFVLPDGAVLAAPALLEDLRYQIAVLVWPDAAQVRVTLTNQGQGRLVAEVLGETRGFIKVMSGNHKERLQTEMVWRKGRLVPLVYREESWRHGKRAFKEYRFNYPRARLALWEWHQGKGLLKKWETDLPEQVYDPLSAFYNCRLKILGPTREGETSTIRGIPYPQPEALEVSLGPETVDGRQAKVSLVNPVFAGTRGVVFAMIDAQRVPHQAWTTVFGVTVRGALLPGSVMMPAKLPGLPASGPAATRSPQANIPTPDPDGESPP